MVESKCGRCCFWFSMVLEWITFIALLSAIIRDEPTIVPECCFFGVASLAYLIGTCCSQTSSYICSFRNVKHISEVMNKMFTQETVERWSYENYHYEKTITTYHRKDQLFDEKVKSKPYKVVTEQDTKFYHFKSCRDISGNLEISGNNVKFEKPFVKLHFVLRREFYDEETRIEFDRKERNFYRSHNNDIEQSVSSDYYLNDFEEYSLVRVTNYKPSFFGIGWLIFFTLVMLAPCYFVYVNSLCSHEQEFVIRKVVSDFHDLNSQIFDEKFRSLNPCLIFCGEIMPYGLRSENNNENMSQNSCIQSRLLRV